jgi:hypothetical protein
MVNFRIFVAMLIGAVIVLGVMTILAVSSSTSQPALRQALLSCELGKKIEIVRPAPKIKTDKVPTLAPPRTDIKPTADKSLHTPPLGQPVFVRIETDHNEIEVGWASPELMGR